MPLLVAAALLGGVLAFAVGRPRGPEAVVAVPAAAIVLIDGLVPRHSGFLSLLAMAALAAVLSNLLNNLPATLVLLPAVHDSPGLLLAMLIGVNVGPNLTYVGSLATLLRSGILHKQDAAPHAWDFLRLGLLTVPAALIAGVTALWHGLWLTGTA
jgi:arsenical pump membrane protein